MTFINYDDFSFLLVTRPFSPHPLVQVPGCGGAACLSGVEPQPQPRVPARRARAAAAPSVDSPLRTPGPRPRVPRLTRPGGGMQDCGGSETLRGKHAEMPEERGRDAPRDTETETGRWQRHFQRDTGREGGRRSCTPRPGGLHGDAPRTQHTGAHTATHGRTLPPPAPRRFPPAAEVPAARPGGRGCVCSSRAPGRVVRVGWGLRGHRRREPTPPRGA